MKRNFEDDLMPPLSTDSVALPVPYFPPFTRAGDSDDELRLIDLELRMLSLEQAAIDARSR